MNTQLQADSTLADGLAAGNPAAWAEFAREYLPLARGAARKCGLQSADCEDAAQDVLIRVHKGIANYDASKGEFRKWFSAVCRSAILRIKHHNARAVPLAETDSEGDCPLDVQAKDAVDNSGFAVEVLRDALADVQGSLGERTYLAFARQWQGESAEDVAYALGMSLAAAYMAKSRGLAALRAAVLA